MKFELSESDDAMVLRLEGECTVECARELKDALLSGLEKSEKLLVNCSKVTDVDISCLQLLYSAFGTSAKMGKRLLLDADLPEQLSRLVIDTGYSGALGFEDAGAHQSGEGR